MITEIEQALVKRLTLGLGRLVNTVKSYGGELDDESINVGRLPMCLVTFGGSKIARMGTNAKRHQSTASFVVIVMVRSLRSNMASRQGGVIAQEVGVNQLITAVRRLLDAQTLGGIVKPLKPVRVKTLFNNATFRAERLTVYSIEYEAIYDDCLPLEDGKFPAQTRDVSHPDYVFNGYQGELSPDDPILEHISGKIFDPTTGAEMPFDVETKE